MVTPGKLWPLLFTLRKPNFSYIFVLEEQFKIIALNLVALKVVREMGRPFGVDEKDTFQNPDTHSRCLIYFDNTTNNYQIVKFCEYVSWAWMNMYKYI